MTNDAIPARLRLAAPSSPVPALLGSLAVGAALSALLVVGPASRGSEAQVTGTALLGVGLTLGLAAAASMRLSAQPQAWLAAPAGVFAAAGLLLVVLQPGSTAIDLLGWLWPPALVAIAVWMLLRVRAGLAGRGRWLLVPLIALLALVGVGGAAVTIGAATASAPPAAGRLVDVGGRSMYIECTGSGGPAVILEAGLGDASPAWARIAPAVSGSTTVCAYDRAGHGRSDDAGPQDGVAIADDLHALLGRAGVAGPYVLVGHSSGGDYVRVYAARYPDDVAGMVLLDAQPADAFTALPTYRGFYTGYRMAAALAPTLARIGILAPILGLPADQSTPAAGRAFRDEVASLPAALDQAATLTSIGGKPLVVVSAGTGEQDGWAEAQRELTALSTAGVQRFLPAATHTSVITGDDAPASARAILDVLTAVRTGTAGR